MSAIDPRPVLRPKPAGGNRRLYPADLAVIGDPHNGVVDVNLDPGGNEPVETITLTTDLMISLHTRLSRKVEQLQENR